MYERRSKSSEYAGPEETLRWSSAAVNGTFSGFTYKSIPLHIPLSTILFTCCQYLFLVQYLSKLIIPSSVKLLGETAAKHRLDYGPRNRESAGSNSKVLAQTSR
jgi:hypothetical protein